MIIKAVVFDMYQTLITVFDRRPYYSAQMALDVGVPTEEFRKYWHSYENDRTLGKCDLLGALRGTMHALGLPEAMADRLYKKRIQDQHRIFSCIQPSVLSMLDVLKNNGIRIGLISNCYLEERDQIVASPLQQYFDVQMLSCEQGIAKPDPEIFHRCIHSLSMPAEEIFYVGDGGSMELQQAKLCGMHPLQACWFMRDDEPDQPCGRKDHFAHLETPRQLLTLVFPQGIKRCPSEKESRA